MSVALKIRVFRIHYTGWLTIKTVVTAISSNGTSGTNCKLAVTYGGAYASGTNTSYVNIESNKAVTIYNSDKTLKPRTSTDYFDGSTTVKAELTINGSTVSSTTTLSNTLNDIMGLPFFCIWGYDKTLYFNEQQEVYFGNRSSNPPSTTSGVTYDCYACIGNTKIKVAGNVSNYNAEWNWTPSIDDFASEIGSTDLQKKIYTLTEAKDESGKPICTYYSIEPADTSSAANRIQFSIFLPSSIRPTILTVTPSDTQGYRSEFGVYLQGKSILAATTQANGVYNSTITKVNYAIDNKTGSATDPSLVKTIGLLEQSGSRTLTTTVTDSRGRTAVRTTAITVAAYVKPTVSLQANRWDVANNETDDFSTTVRLIASGSIPSINEHVVSGSLIIQRRTKGVIAWTTVGTYAVTGPSYAVTVDVGSQSVDLRYEYKATVTDSFGTAVGADGSVGFARPILEFHGSGKGVGLGTVAPETGLNIGMQTDFRGTTDDGYSRIQITDPEGNDSVILANLTGDQLQLLTNILGNYDGAVVNSHIFMQNNTAIGGLTTSGEQTPILCMNNSNQVELTWTTGGLKGRVMKEIWSGTWSSGNITVPELPYYNLFLFLTNGATVSTVPILAARYAHSTAADRIIGISGQFENNGSMHVTQIMSHVTKATPTILKQNASLAVVRDQIPSNASFWNINLAIGKIYGIL